MSNPRPSILKWIVIYGAALLAAGALRWLALTHTEFAWGSSLSTGIYVAATVFMAVSVVRRHLGWSAVGITFPIRPLTDLGWGIAGAAAIVVLGELLDPVWIEWFGTSRDLSRFESISTLPALLALLAFSWAFAAFGEEFAFRGILMRGLGAALGNGRMALIFAYLVQALLFGLIHMYQGPAGVSGAFVSALVLGGIVWLARGRIWPAILAHGLGNSYGLISLYLANAG